MFGRRNRRKGETLLPNKNISKDIKQTNQKANSKDPDERRRKGREGEPSRESRRSPDIQNGFHANTRSVMLCPKTRSRPLPAAAKGF